jgi:hypothetical protein
MRGMQTKQTAQKNVDAIRINYNFIREHSAIGKTPAGHAGINLSSQGGMLSDSFYREAFAMKKPPLLYFVNAITF